MSPTTCNITNAHTALPIGDNDNSATMGQRWALDQAGRRWILKVLQKFILLTKAM